MPTLGQAGSNNHRLLNFDLIVNFQAESSLGHPACIAAKPARTSRTAEAPVSVTGAFLFAHL